MEGLYAMNDIARKQKVVSTHRACQRIRLDVQYAWSKVGGLDRLAYARHNRDLQVAGNNTFSNVDAEPDF